MNTAPNLAVVAYRTSQASASEAAAHGRAVDRGDHRLAQAVDALVERGDVLLGDEQAGGLPISSVPGALPPSPPRGRRPSRTPAGTGEDDGPHVGRRRGGRRSRAGPR